MAIYTIQENVRVVVSLLKQYNIRQIVISPGGTNIPFVQAVQADPFFKCYSIVDERSAMYFAIGLYLQTGEIIATSCTSAQATRNYVPGLTEAFYKHVPILAITTSKLERFAYQEYMQAPDQCSLPKDAVKASYDLPPITDDNTRELVCHNATKAILGCKHRSPGPIQLNLRITDAQQGKFENTDLPVIKKVRRYMAWDRWDDLNLDNRKILIVVGEHRPFDDRQTRALEAFCESHDAVVYVNHLSNYSGKYKVDANLLVSAGGFSQLKPDLLITIGGQTGDYSIYGSLHSIGKAEHWRVAEDGDFIDTYGHLTRIFECPDFYFFERMPNNGTVDHLYYKDWLSLNSQMNYDVELPLSNLYVAQQLYKLIPQNSIMNFAILNSLRCWSYFPLDPSIQGYGNVAAFGIDGCNSMLIGESMNTSELCFIVTGDLAYFYDMNALGIRHIKNNVRILLINNFGGAEFQIMTKKWKDKFEIGEYISANGHNGNTRGWAENCGFKYLSASDKEEFNNVKNEFVGLSDSPIVFEIFTTERDEIIARDLFLEANNVTASKDKLKCLIASIVGEKGVKILKKLR